MRAELVVIHDLKERVLGRRSKESRAALRILPYNGNLPVKAFTSGSGLELSINVCVARIEKRHQDASAPDTQICDRNRTI